MKPQCSNCGRETYDKCDECGAYVCDLHYAPSMSGPEESCIATHLGTTCPSRDLGGYDPRPDPRTNPEYWNE